MVDPEGKIKSQGNFTGSTMGNTTDNNARRPPGNMPVRPTNSPGKFNLKETIIWKDTVGLVQKLWDSYLKLLSSYFQKMSRDEQEELITKYCWIISVGGVLLVWCQIYSLFHPIIRVFAFPISLGAAYWFGKRIVSGIVIERLSKYLND